MSEGAWVFVICFGPILLLCWGVAIYALLAGARYLIRQIEDEAQRS